MGSFTRSLSPAGLRGRRRGARNASLVRHLQADAWARDMIAVIKPILDTGYHGPKDLAQQLNALGIKTRRGKSWHPTTVRALCRRLDMLGLLRLPRQRYFIPRDFVRRKRS